VRREVRSFVRRENLTKPELREERKAGASGGENAGCAIGIPLGKACG